MALDPMTGQVIPDEPEGGGYGGLMSMLPFAAMMMAQPLVGGVRQRGAAAFVARKMTEAEGKGWTLAKLQRELARANINKKWGTANIQNAFQTEFGLRVQRGEGFWARLQGAQMMPTEPVGEVTAAAPAAVAAVAPRPGMGGGPSVAARGAQSGAGVVGKETAGQTTAKLRAVSGGARAGMPTSGRSLAVRLGRGRNMVAGLAAGGMGAKGPGLLAKAGTAKVGMKGLGLLALAALVAQQAFKFGMQLPFQREMAVGQARLGSQQLEAQAAGQPKAEDIVTQSLLEDEMARRQGFLSQQFGGVDFSAMQVQANQQKQAEQMQMLRQLQIQQKLAKLTPSESFVGGSII